MYKYYLKYFSDNKEAYVGALDDVEHKSKLIVENKENATIFYGEGGMQLIADIVENDKNNPLIKDIYSEYEIIEENEEARHHFELINALQNEFGISMRSDVDKDFPLIVNGIYTLNEKTGLPIVSEMCHSELARYYEWLKQNKKRLSESESRQVATKNHLQINKICKVSK